ncbi:MAG: hypothetical protein RR904_07295 [Bacilli bacterium]
MNKEDLYKQIEDLHHNLKKYRSVESTEDDVKALEIIMDLIMLGVGAFTTDELISELTKRKGVLVLKKIKDLDEGAVG